MAAFEMPVELYMSSPVRTIRPDASLRQCGERLEQLGISSLAVVDADDRLIGVVSRTDVLRLGRAGDGDALPADRTVADAMTEGAIAHDIDDSVAAACRRMVVGGVHRVFVTRAGALVGVLSTHDVMLAIRDERLAAPISAFMSQPIITVDIGDSIAVAAAQLERAHITGLVVTEHDWPVGLFTQIEALQSRDLPDDTPVDDVMDPALICLPLDVATHRAAAHATAVRARRIIACKDRHMRGILTGLDFARAALRAADAG